MDTDLLYLLLEVFQINNRGLFFPNPITSKSFSPQAKPLVYLKARFGDKNLTSCGALIILRVR